MMARPVAEFLSHFGKESVSPPPIEPAVDFLPVAPWPQESVEMPEEDPAQLLEAARETARAEGLAAAREEFAAELAEQRQRYSEELAVARQHWLEEESAQLRTALANGLAEIETRLADALGRLLQDFVTDRWRRQMVDELMANIAVLLASKDAISIEISGSIDLIEILRVRLADAPAQIVFEPAAGPDIRVRAEQTVIETQLSSWMARISAEMES